MAVTAAPHRGFSDTGAADRSGGHGKPFRIARGRARIPALVMGGSADQVFPASMLFFTAASWNAETQIIEGAGHMLMLDPQWTDAAGRLEEWLDSLA